jgi:hypothetical protein
MTEGKPYKIKGSDGKTLNSNYGIHKRSETTNTGTRYPTSIPKFRNENKTIIHPTQKPINLLLYLNIKTYSNENNTVLDFTMGSGSTGVACKLSNRQFIGIEKDPEIYFSAVNRFLYCLNDKGLAGVACEASYTGVSCASCVDGLVFSEGFECKKCPDGWVMIVSVGACLALFVGI